MPLARLDSKALSAARIARGAPLCLRAGAWDSEIDLPAQRPSDPEPNQGVALVRVVGPLSKEPDTMCGWWDGYGGSEGIAARFERACEDANTEAVVVYFETPGGAVSGLEECVRRMREAKRVSGKPILGFVDEACSAGYWIAAGVCDRLYGGERAEAGSIGCYVPHESIAGALEKKGVAVTLIADPPGKTAGNCYEPLSDLGRVRIDRGVKDTTARFIGVVETERGIPEKALRSVLDGDVLVGVAAVEFGLLDGISTLEEVAALARAMAREPAHESGVTQ